MFVRHDRRTNVAPADSLRTREQFLREKVREAGRVLQIRQGGRTDVVPLILLVLDAESDEIGCPREWGPRLLATATAERADIPCLVSISRMMLENWIVAAADSLAGTHGFPNDMASPSDAETVRGAGWLTKQRRRVDPTAKYSKPGDAKPLFRDMDLSLAETNSPSFRRLCRKLREMIPPPPEPVADAPPPTSPRSTS